MLLLLLMAVAARAISPDDLEVTASDLISDVVERHFMDARCVCVLTQTSSELMRAVASLMPVHYVTMDAPEDAVDGGLQEALDARCLAFIIAVADAREAILRVTAATGRAQQRANRRYVVLRADITTPSVLAMPHMILMPDLVELVAVADGVAALTHRYVGPDWSAVVRLGEWRGGAWRTDGHSGAGLFPDKLSDLGGRHLLFATFNYLPYSVVDVPKGVFDGMELRISAEFAARHNVTWSVYVDAEHQWGQVYDNGSGDGVLGAVATGRAHLGFGALYLWYHEYHFLDFSFPYIRTGITCLAPSPRALPGWLTPALPFQGGLWATLAASLLLAVAALYAVSELASRLLEPAGRPASLLDCAFHVLGLLVLQASGTNDRGPVHHLLAWFLVVFMLVTTSYSSGLASVLAVPRYEPPIDTPEDLVRTGTLWAATHPAWVFSLREATDPIIRRVYEQFRVFDEDTLHERAVAGDLAFSIERLPAGYYAVGDYVDVASVRGLRLMKQDVYWERSTTVFPKGSPFVAPFDVTVHRLLDAGLMLAWEGQVARAALPQAVQIAVGLSNTPPAAGEPSAMGVVHMQGAFVLLAIGLLLGVAVMGAEMLLGRRALVKRA